VTATPGRLSQAACEVHERAEDAAAARPRLKRLIESAPVQPPARADQRRQAGQRTRERLMDAAVELLAERGAEGVTLREITDAAEANVAAVS
jgi:DNA-binding transcriptional regulator YbjK